MITQKTNQTENGNYCGEDGKQEPKQEFGHARRGHCKQKTSRKQGGGNDWIFKDAEPRGHPSCRSRGKVAGKSVGLPKQKPGGDQAKKGDGAEKDSEHGDFRCKINPSGIQINGFQKDGPGMRTSVTRIG
jgi:hypothetical protein